MGVGHTSQPFILRPVILADGNQGIAVAFLRIRSREIGTSRGTIAAICAFLDANDRVAGHGRVTARGSRRAASYEADRFEQPIGDGRPACSRTPDRGS